MTASCVNWILFSMFNTVSFLSHTPAAGKSLAPAVIIVLGNSVTQPHFPLGKEAFRKSY